MSGRREAWKLTGYNDLDWLLWGMISVVSIMWIPIVGIMFETGVTMAFLPLHIASFAFCFNESLRWENR